MCWTCNGEYVCSAGEEAEHGREGIVLTLPTPQGRRPEIGSGTELEQL